MKKALSVTLFLLFAILVTSVLFVPQILADVSGGDVNAKLQKQTDNATDDKANLTKTSWNLMEANGYWLLGSLAGTPGNKQLSDRGALGAVGNMVASMYSTKPASESYYFADLMQNMGLAPQAYAQGLGFSALQPVLNLWKIFRDISYVFFVFIFLIIGFAIMFRKNLGGQAAVTIQQALPRIVVALLAVSFSYAIAGLMIDLMWIVMYFLITMFNGAGLLQSDLFSNYRILNLNVFDVFTGILSTGFANQAGLVVGSFVNNVISTNQGLNNVLGNVAGGITSIVAALIIFVAIIYAMFRTFFSLIKVYFEIILTIIFAPIILMMGAINGNAFGNWLKGLVVNLAVFPVLLVFIIIGFMLINVDAAQGSLPQQLQGSGFIPPFIPGRTESGTIGFIGGIAAIMLLPEVVGLVMKNKPASIFDELGGKAWANAMKGRGLGVPAGSALLGAGAGAAGGGLFGLYRGAQALKAGEGFGSARQKFTQATALGALGGAFGGPAVASGTAYRAARGVVGSLTKQAQDVASEYTIDAYARHLQKKEGIAQRIGKNILIARNKNARDAAPQSTTEQATTQTNTDPTTGIQTETPRAGNPYR